MYIVVHADRMKYAMDAFITVRDEILKDFKSIMSCPRQGVIYLLNDFIRIDFRCGGMEKLAGIRPDYFYCCEYTPEAQMMLQYGAVKCNGRELNNLAEIYNVVIEFLKQSEVKAND